jgi:hypothetical protein
LFLFKKRVKENIFLQGCKTSFGLDNPNNANDIYINVDQLRGDFHRQALTVQQLTADVKNGWKKVMQE